MRLIMKTNTKTKTTLFNRITKPSENLAQNLLSPIKRSKFNYALGGAMLSLGLLCITVGAKAEVKPADVQEYAVAMKQAANTKDLEKVAELIAEDVIIKITRNGKSATLNKEGYLKRLQKNWQSTDTYHYAIEITDAIASGDHIKANITIQETVTKDGQPSTYVTESRATLAEDKSNNKAVLLKAVAQVRID